MCDGPIETVKYIWVNILCTLDWIFSQNCRNSLLLHTASCSTSEEYKNLDACCARQTAFSQQQRQVLSDRRIQKFKFICDFTFFEQFATLQIWAFLQFINTA